MPDNIFGDNKDSEGKENQPQQNEENKKILDTLASLETKLNDVATRLDAAESANKETEEEPEEGQPAPFRPKTWDEIPQKAEEIATDIVEKKLSERDEAAKAEREAATKQQKQIDTFIDNQTADLEKQGALPKIENPNDENDKGRVARRELFGLAAHIGTMDLGRVNELKGILNKVGYTYDPRAQNGKGAYLRSGGMPAGYNAPVSSSSRSTGGVSNNPTYKDISRAPSLDYIVERFNNT